jgi:hypothetical protein
LEKKEYITQIMCHRFFDFYEPYPSNDKVSHPINAKKDIITKKRKIIETSDINEKNKKMNNSTLYEKMDLN